MLSSNRCVARLAFFGLLLLGITIQGCGTGKTIVIKPITTPIAKSTSLDIAAGTSTVSVPPDVTSDFQQKLEDLLFKDGGFTKQPSGTVLKYRVVSYDSGNQFMRWLCGGGVFQCGKGKLVVETDFIDKSGNLATTIQGEGTVDVGFFGGTFSSAINYTAEEIAKYTTANFK